MKKNVLNIIWWTVFVICLVIVFNIVLAKGNLFSDYISNDAWAGFLGSFLGGLATLLGVYLTIQYSIQNSKNERNIQRKADIENNRLRIKPYIDTSFRLSKKGDELEDDVSLVVIRNDFVECIKHGFSEYEKRIIKDDRIPRKRIFIRYSMRNLGSGNAVNLSFRINNFPDNDASPFYYAIKAGEERNLFFSVELDEVKDILLYITIKYDDIESIGHYCNEDVLEIDAHRGIMEVSFKLHKPPTLKTK